MPELVCSAQSCVYNNAMYCSRGDIEVGGRECDRMPGYLLRELQGAPRYICQQFDGNAVCQYGHPL